MIELLRDLASVFGTDRYGPQSVGLISDPAIIVLFLLFNLVTGLSWTAIGGMFVAHRYEAVRFMRFIFMKPAAVGLYGCLLVAGGVNLMTVTLTLFWGVYYLDLIARCVLAVVSTGTAITTALAFYSEEALPSIAEALRGRAKGS